MPGIEVRRATEADIPLLAGFRTRMFLEMGYATQDLEGLVEAQVAYFEAATADGRLHGWLAEEEGRLVGAVELDVRRVAPGPVTRGGALPYVYGLFVEPTHRRRGIAGRLMETIRGWAEDEGYEAVALHASPAGRPLYEKLGFERTSEMRLLTTHADRHRPAAED